MTLWPGLAVLGGFAAILPAQATSVLPMDEFLQDWKQSAQFTIDVAQAMPAEFYTFKPNPEEMTFGEQMVHIAASNVYRFNEITGIKGPFELSAAKAAAGDKEAVLRMLRQSFDYVIQALPRITPQQLERTWKIPSWKGRPEPNARAMVLNMFVHTAHHRAQCEVYLRVKNIKPPTYTF